MLDRLTYTSHNVYVIVALTPTVTSLLFVPDMHTRRKSFGVAEHVLTLPHIAHLSLVILML